MTEQPERRIAVLCSAPNCGRPITISAFTSGARCTCGAEYDRAGVLSLPLAPRRHWPSE